MNASQNAEFSTKFPTLDKDFSELRKFQSKPLNPRCNTSLKTPNPEGFLITPRSRQDRLVRLKTSRGGYPPLEGFSTARTEPFKERLRLHSPILASLEKLRLRRNKYRIFSIFCLDFFIP